MLNLFKSEFFRYRYWALWLMVAHLGVIWLFTKITIFGLYQPDLVLLFILLIGLIGFIFGLVQMGLHKKPNNWAYLIHRPLSSRQIFISLVTAVLALVTIVVFIPQVILLGVYDGFTDHPIDLRHYMMPFYFLAIGFSSYLVGAYTQLYPNKGVIISLSIVGFFAVGDDFSSTFLAIFIPMTFAIGWLLYLTNKAFKPDLGTHFKSKLAIVLGALPLQIGLVALLILVKIPVYHLPLILTDMHPETHPVSGSFETFQILEDEEKATFFLKNSDDPRAKTLEQQARFGDVVELYLDDFFHLRGNIVYQDKYARLESPDGKTSWSFSHDEMLFKGWRQVDKKLTGWIGRHGFITTLSDAQPEDRFTQVPLMHGSRYIVTQHQISRINYEDQLVDVLFTLQDSDETLSGRVNITESLAAVGTNKNLYIFDVSDFADDGDHLDPDYTIPHPEEILPIGYIQAVTLVDGYALTYVSDRQLFPDLIKTKTLFAGLDGTLETVGDYTFSTITHPSFFYHWTFLSSPGVYFLAPLFEAMGIPGNMPVRSFAKHFPNPSRPAYVTWIALIFALICGAIVDTFCRRQSMPNENRFLWVAMTLVMGVAGLISFFILNNWRKPPQKSTPQERFMA